MGWTEIPVIIGPHTYALGLLASAYLTVGAVVALGFMVQRFLWGLPPAISPPLRAARVVVVGLVVGVFWLPILVSVIVVAPVAIALAGL